MSRVRDDAKKKGYTLEKLGVHLGYSKGNMSTILNAKRNINFNKFFKLLQFIYEDKFDTIIDTLLAFAYKTDDIMNVRLACEWFYNHGKLEELVDLFNKHSHDPFIKVYTLIFKSRYKNLKRYDLLAQIEELKDSINDCTEASILNRIVSLYAYIDYKSYLLIPDMATTILKNLDQVKNEYLKESFKYRIMESVIYSYLKQSNIKKVEDLTNKIVGDSRIIFNFPMFYTQILMLLSEANVFRNYEKSKEYLVNALELFYKNGLKHPYRENALKSTWDFVNIYHNKFEDLYLDDEAEYIHYLAKQKNTDKKKVLNMIEALKQKNGKLSPFQLYYKSLITNNLEDVHNSLIGFEKEGDVHYAELPKSLLSISVKR